MRKDFTIDPVKWKGLPEYFDQLHSVGMKTVMILDPALIVNETNYWPFETGISKNVFIRRPDDSDDFADTNSTIMLGYVI
jgi:alpha-glucosidase (family GH31 glycosyl hydrolase)